jgi:hypothetical protein
MCTASVRRGHVTPFRSKRRLSRACSSKHRTRGANHLRLLRSTRKHHRRPPTLGLASRNPPGPEASVCDMAAACARFLGPGHSRVSRLKRPFGVRANTLMQVHQYSHSLGDLATLHSKRCVTGISIAILATWVLTSIFSISVTLVSFATHTSSTSTWCGLVCGYGGASRTSRSASSEAHQSPPMRVRGRGSGAPRRAAPSPGRAPPRGPSPLD